jgi:hypothetical protein
MREPGPGTGDPGYAAAGAVRQLGEPHVNPLDMTPIDAAAAVNTADARLEVSP